MSINYLEKLPSEIENIIFEYAIKCKKEQNFYINKNIANLLIKRFENCKEMLMINTYICTNCNTETMKFLKYYNVAFF